MSEVWNHFYMAPNGLSVNCNHCGKFMKRSDSSTKSMWGHLKAFHADLVGEETFRLKRTRRMRGSSGATSTKKSGKKGSKKEQQKAAQQRRMAAEAAAASGSSSSGSSSEEEERQSEFSGGSSRGTTPGEVEAREIESSKVELAEKNSSSTVAALSIQSLLELSVAELEKNEKEKAKQGEMAPKTEEPVETPTQPYVKRKRQQQQNGQQTNLQGQAQQPPTEQPIPMEQPAAHPVPAAAQEGEKSQNVATPPPAPAQPKKSPSSSPINPPPPPPDDVLANGIPHSGNQSAFSKYSTAALLQQAHPEGGKKSPAHGAEAPKSRAQTQPQSVGAPRSTSYGLEAMTGLNSQQLGMLGLADPQLMVQLETAAAMSQLVQMQQPKGQQNQMQQQNERALNELLALYAASAAAASALQQQQDGLKAKTMGAQNQQQQQLAAQQAAAAAWLYNWEWMAAAQRMGNAVQNGQTAGLANLLGQQQFGGIKGALGTNGQKGANGNGNNAAEVAAALGMGLNGNGQQKTTKNGNGQQQQQTDAMLAKAAMSQLLIQAQQKQQSANAGAPKVEAAQQSQTQKRKSPTNEEGATNSPLQVLADTAASTAAVERRMQQSREETGGSPPKHARKEAGANQQQQQSTLTMGEREKALAESLVLYGMHRIAMELQLSYSVHANKGKAEYAFYCANGANGNANIQRMVTLTESADQILHIREYANGAVVAEECWPKSAEPYNLLSSLRDKCQRRLCAAQ